MSPPFLPSPWSPRDVAEAKQTIARTKPWDILVVGAGITGAGIARDAALRGLSVLVVEAQDIAFGTSSRSSRLIHGGVRYLEQGALGLVFQALRERACLYKIAGHLVRPARFLFPAYRGDRLGTVRLRVGLTLYDLLNLGRGQSHEFVGPEECCELEPLLARENLLGAVQYEDAITDDARLTLATIQDARNQGAHVVTYTRVKRITRRDDLQIAELDDGSQIAALQIVVAAGPWSSPQLLGSSGEALLQLSKGIHIVMRAEHVPVRQPIVIQAQKQRRILFVVPWGTRTYLGTTDAPYSGDPGRSGVTEQDEAELLNLVARVLPRARLDPRNIVSAWSGVRPLLRDRSGPNTVELSRKHAIVETQSGAIAVVGGKLTTYRAMAEEAVDVVIDRLGDRLGTRRLSACSTAEAPLVPGPPLTAEERNDPILSGLFERHGALARSILAVVREDPTRAAFVVPGLPYRWCEVDWALRYEGVTHLVDLMRRRIPLALTATDRGGSAARSIARALVDARGGSERDVEDELEQYGEWIRLETRREVLVDSQNRSAHHKTARVNQESG